MDKDYFTLMLSAKWDPIPSMPKSYPTRQRFYGSDDFFDSALIKSNVLIMGSCELNGKHDIFMPKGKGIYFYGGHDRKTFSIRWGSANGLGFTP
jgi:hypothetical protein